MPLSNVQKQFMADGSIWVTLCWSLTPRHVHEIRLQVPAGSTVAFVLEQGVVQSLQNYSSPDTLSSLQFQQPGIWGKKVSWTDVVKADDRIELYRPLKVDPKISRRQRFKRQGKGRTGLFANRKSGSAAGY